MEISKATKSGTYKTFLRINLPRLIVPEKEAMTVVLLGNLMCIGVMGDKDLKRNLDGQMWSVAPLSRIQEEEMSPEGETKICVVFTEAEAFFIVEEELR